MNGKKNFLIAIIIFHAIIVIANVCAFFILPFVINWYIWIPICTFLFWFFNERNLTCKLTNLENQLRKQLGMPEIKGFVRHYFKYPVRKLLRSFVRKEKKRNASHFS